MQLYHGSYLSIPKPSLDYGRHNLDFGKGLYVTALKEQSAKWVIRRAATNRIIHDSKESRPIVTVYNIEFANSDFNILSFNEYNEEWLDHTKRYFISCMVWTPCSYSATSITSAIS